MQHLTGTTTVLQTTGSCLNLPNNSSCRRDRRTISHCSRTPRLLQTPVCIQAVSRESFVNLRAMSSVHSPFPALHPTNSSWIHSARKISADQHYVLLAYEGRTLCCDVVKPAFELSEHATTNGETTTTASSNTATRTCYLLDTND